MPFTPYIQTKQDLIDAVLEYGIVPFFAGSIPGFSIEEHVDPRAWFYDGIKGVWEWKGPVIRQAGCAYGKFFQKKAAFVRRDVFADLANYRRNGYDYEGFFNDGFAPLKDKALYDLLEAKGPLLSKELKKLGNYRKGGASGFDTCINWLQAQCFVLISDFVYQTDRFGNEYGWGIAEYATPEQFMGSGFARDVYRCEPEESYGRLLGLVSRLFPSVSVDEIKKFVG
ncbi:MAG: hypothetical protein IKT23_04210 [Clostridia bacterium]|nr:hypothetical protein [Clostridia bacterium]